MGATGLIRMAVIALAVVFANCGVAAQTTVNIDWRNSYQYVTLSANTVFQFINLQRRDMVVYVTNPGSYTLTWPQKVVWPGGTTPTQSTNGKTDMYLLYRGYDTLIVGQALQDYRAISVVDDTPPDSVTDLVVSTTTARTATLTWTTPTGVPHTYDVRYALKPIGNATVTGGGSPVPDTVVHWASNWNYGGTAQTTLTVSLTVPTMTNGILIGGASWYGAATCDSAKWNGTKMGRDTNATNSDHGVAAFHLLDPEAGAYNVVYYFSAAVEVVGGVSAYAGVDQTTPVAAVAVASGYGTSVSVTITAASDEVTAGVLTSWQGTFTPADSSRWDGSSGDDNEDSYGWTKHGALSALTGTLSSAQNWAAAALVLQPGTGMGAAEDTIAWADATPVVGEPIPEANPVPDDMVVTGLSPETEYWFAMKSADAAGNISGISNTPKGTTTAESGTGGTIATYTKYVDGATGNDNNDGSSGSPWKTIAKANLSLVPGDTLGIKAGTYTDAISPATSGTASQPIIYRAYQGHDVRVSAAYGVYLVSKQYVVVDSVKFQNLNSAVYMDGANHNEIKRTRTYNTAAWAAFDIRASAYNQFLYNFIDRADTGGAWPNTVHGESGDGIQLLNGSNHNIVRGNYVTRCNHSPITTEPNNNNYNRIDSNYLYLNHNAIDVSGQYNVMERNFAWKSNGVFGRAGNAYGLKTNYGFVGENNIVRYNVAIDDSLNPLGQEAWRPVLNFGSWTNAGVNENARIYHNTGYFNSDEPTETGKWPVWVANDSPTATDKVLGFKLFNNLFYLQVNGAPIVDHRDYSQSYAAIDHVWAGNIIHGQTNANILRLNGTVYTMANAKSLYPAIWLSSNQDVSVTFADETNRDLTPATGSNAVDAAVPLTTTTNSGAASISMTVADARWFSDGAGIVEGDSVKVQDMTTGDAVAITAVNYSTGALTLEAPKTWSSGKSVWFYRSDKFKGSAPDVGALEKP